MQANINGVVAREHANEAHAHGTLPEWRGLAQRERYHRVRVWANSCVDVALCDCASPPATAAAASVMWAKLTRTPPPPFLRYPQLQRRYAPSRPAFSARIPSLIHGATDDAFVTALSKLDKMPQRAVDPGCEELRRTPCDLDDRAQRGAVVR